MKIPIEVSNPHYHPGPDFSMEVTKKRDLSVPPHWVANERMEKDGKSYAIVMPPRAQELYEIRQEVHIHFPEYVTIMINGSYVRAKVKVQLGEEFEPRVHFDHIESEELNIKSGDIAELWNYVKQQRKILIFF